MEREILFRGKREDNGEWVKGLPSYDMNGKLEEIEVYRGFCDCITYDVDSKTVCQYTGFHDNTKWEQLSESEKKEFLSEWNYKKERRNIKDDWNGRKIFEGDIVSDGVGNLYKVMHNEVFQFHFICIGSKYHEIFVNGMCDLYSLCKKYKTEVIGNIFDNPELLKGA